MNTPRLPTLREELQLLPFDREGGAPSTIRDKNNSHLQNPRNLKHACAKLAHGCTREGEKASSECVWLRTDLNTTSPFQRAHRWMPHKSLRQEHGPGNECIVGCQKRHKAAARLRPPSTKCHTNLNGRNSAHFSEFLTGCHSRLTAALRLEPASFSPDSTRDSSAAVTLKLQLSPLCGIVAACYAKQKLQGCVLKLPAIFGSDSSISRPRTITPLPF